MSAFIIIVVTTAVIIEAFKVLVLIRLERIYFIILMIITIEYAKMREEQFNNHTTHFKDVVDNSMSRNLSSIYFSNLEL